MVMIVVSDNLGGSIFVFYLKVEFIKNTIFKDSIKQVSESGIREANTDFRKFYDIKQYHQSSEQKVDKIRFNVIDTDYETYSIVEYQNEILLLQK